MPAKDTQNAIRNVLRALNDEGLLSNYNEPILESYGDDVRVSWPNQLRGAPYSSNEAFGTFSQYTGILDHNAYSAILKDGALLRASYDFKRKDLVGHSLWYWPCPLKIDYTDIVEFGLRDLIDLYSTGWRDFVRFRTPLRFDYDPANAKVGHPPVHLHMQTHDCRTAVERPLSFAAFVDYIFRNFYYAEWCRCDENDVWKGLPQELDEQHRSFLDANLFKSLHVGWKLQ